MHICNFFKIIITLLTFTGHTNGLFLTNGHCQKNISIEYQVPVTKTRLTTHHDNDNNVQQQLEQYVEYEEHLRWDTAIVCCPGYRILIFNLCEPICETTCPPHSYCAEPNKCICERGYEPSHHPNREHQLICRPTCLGGCPQHSHCIARNECVCHTGYRDISGWFGTLRCERIHCGPDQHYDIARKKCVKFEMSIKDLKKKVGKKLTQGLDVTDTNMDLDYKEY
ncbi:uncharacterized protein LOC119687482 [Teleopsis dalmanni]|uniref:uncharacterized protein LOC119687482 n=1 Tax=Teleopsis dalmanni TaxID=139649 RepID=UPI0018CD04AE|nr:uncharacterized protein LOC119687482 [Teleopsis dalmanni]